MLWPIVLVLAVASGTPIGMSAEPDRPQGYQTNEECQQRLPALVQQSQAHPWPVPFAQLGFAAACIPMPPQQFFEEYVEEPKVIEREA
jgi:hypothetical protein